MLTVIKTFALALFATFALPLSRQEPVATLPEPPASSQDVTVGAPPPDRSRQASVSRLNDDPAPATKSLSAERTADRPTPAPTSLPKAPLEIGDNLKIGFYETIDVGSSDQSGSDGVDRAGALRTFYQRMDISGDYAVEQDGSISIPLLGRLQAVGRSLDDIRADLAASFASVMGRSANVDLRILDRPPIYVVGEVKNPGAYKYAPGMIVLQAIALAGGLDRGKENLSGLIDGAREMERFRVANLQVEQLLARRARLEAERDEVSAFSTPDNALSLLASAEGGISPLSASVGPPASEAGKSAAPLPAAESAIARADQVRRQQRGREIALRVAAARNEVVVLGQKLDQFDIQKDLRIERLDAMQKLKDHGVVTSNNVLILRTELADIEARRQDCLVAVIQAKTRLAEAEEEGAKLTSDSTADLAKEIATIDEEIDAARETTVSARALATIFYKPFSSGLEAESYEIVRQSPEGSHRLEATETSPLLPGDTLKITLNGASTKDPISVSRAPEYWLAPARRQ